MSARKWLVLSWVWLAMSIVWTAVDAPRETMWGTLIAAVIARGIGDILKAIEGAMSEMLEKVARYNYGITKTPDGWLVTKTADFGVQGYNRLLGTYRWFWLAWVVASAAALSTPTTRGEVK